MGGGSQAAGGGPLAGGGVNPAGGVNPGGGANPGGGVDPGGGVNPAGGVDPGGGGGSVTMLPPGNRCELAGVTVAKGTTLLVDDVEDDNFDVLPADGRVGERPSISGSTK